MHHIVADGWSLGVLVRRGAAALYAAFASGAAVAAAGARRVQYADYAAWQREWLAGRRARRAQLAYWRQQLAGAPPVLELPDGPAAAGACRRSRGATRTIELPAELVEPAARRCARREGATLFMTLLAGLPDVLLARYSGQDDVVVGHADREPDAGGGRGR